MVAKLILAGAMALSGAVALTPAVDAQRYGGPGYGYGDGGRGYYDQAGYASDGYGRGYRDRGGYARDDGYRGYDQRGYDQSRSRARRCSNGTAGTIIGAIAGGLLGRTIDTRGDRTLGTVLGAGAGALAGHEIERSGNNGYCR